MIQQPKGLRAKVCNKAWAWETTAWYYSLRPTRTIHADLMHTLAHVRIALAMYCEIHTSAKFKLSLTPDVVKPSILLQPSWAGDLCAHVAELPRALLCRAERLRLGGGPRGFLKGFIGFLRSSCRVSMRAMEICGGVQQGLWRVRAQNRQTRAEGVQSRR